METGLRVVFVGGLPKDATEDQPDGVFGTRNSPCSELGVSKCRSVPVVVVGACFGHLSSVFFFLFGGEGRVLVY